MASIVNVVINQSTSHLRIPFLSQAYNTCNIIACSYSYYLFCLVVSAAWGQSVP